MKKSLLSLANKWYSENTEDFSVRILYFFNTINTYFLIAGIASFVIVYPGKVSVIALLFSLFFVVITARMSDFYPTYALLCLPVLIALAVFLPLPHNAVIKLIIINSALFFFIQLFFLSIPFVIVARDIRLPFIQLTHSLFTLAPTTLSFPISVFFSSYLTLFMLATSSCKTSGDFIFLSACSAVLLLAAIIVRLKLPKNNFSVFSNPVYSPQSLFKRVVILNVDGARKDIFDSLHLPTALRLAQSGASHVKGLETVYRALTNPAFASIFTGTTPQFHGVRDNNLGQSIQIEGLPDIVPTISYGSMHVKHFCKKYWNTRVISMPRHSVYKSDEVMVDWLKDDILKRPEIKLFIADFSEADFLAHAYSSNSKYYKQGLKNIDKKIGGFIDWMEEKGHLEDTAIIVCSDHGVSKMDHGYLLESPERYVPFYILGKGIKKGFKIEKSGMIMDICCLVAYMLGVRFPSHARGQIFTEIFEKND